MARRLGQAQEVERRRLAAELHDGVCSNLAAIGLNLALMQKQLPHSDTAGMQRRMSELITLIDEAKANAKDLTVDLRPLLLEDRDLLSALEEYARKFEGSTGIAVEVNGANAGGRLPPEKKIALFRIAQEALTNCAKHAQASVVAIDFNSDSDELLLSVADNGVGVDLVAVSARTQGLGLLSMQERAEAIGGIWRIESAPGKGTRVSVRVGTVPV
jgi:signal transduction histidine kinase